MACIEHLATQAQVSPLGQAISGAVGGLQAAHSRLTKQAAAKKRVYGGRRIVVPPRDPAFAAILPGDSVAEAVSSSSGALQHFWVWIGFFQQEASTSGPSMRAARGGGDAMGVCGP